MTVKQRTLPAVAAAILAAGGTVWVLENTMQPDADTGESSHTLRAEISTTSTAVMVFVVKSKWRGLLRNMNTGVSKFHTDEVELLEGEPVEAVLLGRQSAEGKRQSITCRLLYDGGEADKKTLVVRVDDGVKTVQCEL